MKNMKTTNKINREVIFNHLEYDDVLEQLNDKINWLIDIIEEEDSFKDIEVRVKYFEKLIFIINDVILLKIDEENVIMYDINNIDIKRGYRFKDMTETEFKEKFYKIYRRINK